MPALSSDAVAIAKRQYYDGYCDGYYGCYNSPWNAYGRWILLAVIIVGAFLLFCIFSCITARRRKRRGMQPFMGTGWAAGGAPAYGGPQNYYNNGYNYNQQAPPGGWQQPPPQYGVATADGSHYGKSNPAPYGNPAGGPGGVELQTPGNSYQPQRGGDEVYAPPTGPPPAKDGVVR